MGLSEHDILTLMLILCSNLGTDYSNPLVITGATVFHRYPKKQFIFEMIFKTIYFKNNVR